MGLVERRHRWQGLVALAGKSAQLSQLGRSGDAGQDMKEANASFSQMPFHHSIVTRSPNHMWAISWAMTPAMRARSAAEALVSIHEQGRANEDRRAEVLHRSRPNRG